MTNNATNYVVTIGYEEEEVQEFAENNFKRQLTKEEIDELSSYWWFCDEICDLRNKILHKLINNLMEKYDENK